MVNAVQWTGANRAQVLNFCHEIRFKYLKDIPYVIPYIGTKEIKQNDYIIKYNTEFIIVSKEEYENDYMS